MNLVNNAIINVPEPTNEPIYSYAPGSPERKAMQAALKEMAATKIEIPIIIGGKEVRTGNMGKVTMPHDHGHVLAEYHKAGPKEVQQAIDCAVASQEMWRSIRWEERAAIMLKVAELISKKYRYQINAGAMLVGGKTVFQAEIDAVCELIDFLRFNAKYAEEIYRNQPTSSEGVWNYVQYRPLEGFVFAVTPFNFTAIAGNLPTAPAMMGNTVVWKPASALVYTPYLLMQIFEEAGLPPGVINFVPGSGSDVGNTALASEHLAGIHFTGSTRVFQSMWKTVGENITKYHAYPRIVGETGGKDFIFVHSSADAKQVATGIVRGAFEFQGQKCSAASRAFIPKSLWGDIEKEVRAQMSTIKMGDPTDFTNFVGAVIDKAAFDNISSYLQYTRDNDGAEILIGGGCDDSKGYFVEPTVILATDPHFKTMVEEIFGPVISVYVYDDADYEKTLRLCDESSPYALTGSIFAKDRLAVGTAMAALEHSAGNFYINDKPTGAVVGQQPFGGGRASGTNDKAGSAANLMRWVSMRTVKETFLAPSTYEYPFLQKD
ncbi:L-glutamate gamma-semialdehyde dehydrogenase [Desulforhopalus vacuolatus]|uniref:L-glutamate gamma-semialdehyde dehydrogenase n=1 Tax=Desulforhopalus vacuolatus TaxID=40414 RepID=UPI001964C0DE|nr:L-glutamate gamma-semialdehyde dehydrogenase [Desulforhopalus vacuolatus]MBM9518277.1 L-glutamate gamma-semialdehyde dehydrogenase [Desulforhopalus vacuolatus]